MRFGSLPAATGEPKLMATGSTVATVFGLVVSVDGKVSSNLPRAESQTMSFGNKFIVRTVVFAGGAEATVKVSAFEVLPSASETVTLFVPTVARSLAGTTAEIVVESV